MNSSTWIWILVAIIVVARFAQAAVAVHREDKRPRVGNREQAGDPTGFWHVGD